MRCSTVLECMGIPDPIHHGPNFRCILFTGLGWTVLLLPWYSSDPFFEAGWKWALIGAAIGLSITAAYYAWQLLRTPRPESDPTVRKTSNYIYYACIDNCLTFMLAGWAGTSCDRGTEAEVLLWVVFVLLFFKLYANIAWIDKLALVNPVAMTEWAQCNVCFKPKAAVYSEM